MKIRPLNNQVTGFSSYGADAQSTQKVEAENAKLNAANDDAASVKVQRVNAEIAPAREELVKKLKDQVQNGSYERSSDDIAKALYRDLF